MEHSIIPPSSAGIWGAPEGCPGWPMMSAQYPETERSEHAKRGDAAHYMGAEILKQVQAGYDKVNAPSNWIGQKAPNGVVIDPEIVDSVKIYVDDVILSTSQNHIFYVEERIECPRIHPLSFGYVDCYAHNEAVNDVIIWDFKHGRVKVEVFKNWQMINYASGVLDKLGIDGYSDQFTRVRFRIVQPRAFHRDGDVREWSVMASDLRGEFNLLAANARPATDGTGQAHSGGQCRFCSARFACDAAWEAGMVLYEATDSTEPRELSVMELAKKFEIVQRAKKQLEYLETGLEERIKSLIRSGQQVPGYMVEEGYGREEWFKPVSEVMLMGNMLGHDLKKDSVITPNQARKLGVDESILKAYAGRKKAGFRVVPEDRDKAKLIFGGK